MDDTKKIGLLTFQDTNNFGSMLQTYGLFKAVTDLGLDIEVIDYKNEALARKEVPHLPKLRKNLLKYIINWIRNPFRLKYKALQKFLFENMNVSEKCDKKSIKKVAQRYNIILVGSDMVWEMEIQGGDLTYFLDFDNDASKKVAFASSVGFPWKDEDKKVIKPLLEDFKSIAVRETKSADWVEELIGGRPPVVCDPTMLLSQQEWLKMVKKTKPQEKYILVYFENDNGDCLQTAITYANKNHLKVKCIEYGASTDMYESVYPRTINDFLSLIYNAYLVITASYHGILFSLYFNKSLIYFLRRQTSRVDTLVEKLGIGICNGELIHNNKIPLLDYVLVNNAIEQYREESMRCLKNILAYDI